MRYTILKAESSGNTFMRKMEGPGKSPVSRWEGRSGARIISTSVNRILRVREEFRRIEEIGGGLGERLGR